MHQTQRQATALAMRIEPSPQDKIALRTRLIAITVAVHTAYVPAHALPGDYSIWAHFVGAAKHTHLVPHKK